jgi:hypothetical protein
LEKIIGNYFKKAQVYTFYKNISVSIVLSSLPIFLSNFAFNSIRQLACVAIDGPGPNRLAISPNFRLL